MTDVLALVADLQGRGVTLEPRGDKLAVRPVSRVTAEELARLRQHKAEVLRLLETPALPAPRIRPGAYGYPWPDTLPGLGPRRVVAFSRCADCPDPAPRIAVPLADGTLVDLPGPTGTWVVYGDRPLCLGCARRRAAETPA